MLVKHVFKLESKIGLSGARPAQSIQTTLKRKVDSRSFWTNQECWLIPGRLKPTDAATRSRSEEEEIPRWWFDGPAHLNEEEQAWPKDVLCMAAKEKLRAVQVHLSSAAIQPSFRWRMIQSASQDLPFLIRLDEEFQGYVKRYQQKVYQGGRNRLHQKKRLHSTSNLLGGIIRVDQVELSIETFRQGMNQLALLKWTHRIKRIRIRGSMEPRNDKDKTLGEI